MNELEKPKLNHKYILLVKRYLDSDPAPHVFEYLALRGSKYYFHCADYGIDRLLSKREFNKLLVK